MKKVILAVLYIATVFNTQVSAQIYSDVQVNIHFSIQSFGYGKIEGAFLITKGMAKFDSENIVQSDFDFQIETKSAETGRTMVNHFISKEAFFSVEEYPAINFHSTEISKKGNQYDMKGDLTIKGITKTILIPFEIEEDNSQILLKGTLEMSRFDFDLGANFNQFLIKEMVKVEMEAILPKFKEDQLSVICYSQKK